MIFAKQHQRRIANLKNTAMGFLGRLRANRDGTAMIEFALVGPVLILLLLGTFELGAVMLTSTLMEGALRDASRYGVTGQELNEDARLARIREILGERTLGLVDLDTARIEVLVYPGFADIGQPEGFIDANANASYDAGETFTDTNGNGTWDADSGVPGPGGSGDIVLYRLIYDWPLITPLISSILGSDGTLALTASLVVRNEPWEEP